MGDSLLILYRISIIIFAISSIPYADELQWVDQQINAIKPPRKGVDSAIISKIKNPFIKLNNPQIKKKTKTTKTYKSPPKKIYKISTKTKKTNKHNLNLAAILNNTALINGKWYKIGTKVSGFTLKEINQNHAILVDGKRVLVLSTDTKNTTLKFN